MSKPIEQRYKCADNYGGGVPRLLVDMLEANAASNPRYGPRGRQVADRQGRLEPSRGFQLQHRALARLVQRAPSWAQMPSEIGIVDTLPKTNSGKVIRIRSGPGPQ
jgi:hypothetical protein